MKLAGGLEHARLRAFRKDNPFGMALQFFNHVADESHGALGSPGNAKLQLTNMRRSGVGSPMTDPFSRWPIQGDSGIVRAIYGQNAIPHGAVEDRQDAAGRALHRRQ